MSGRSEEFREFARDRAWPLQQSAYLLCGDWHTAQDVVQETLIKAYRHWPPVGGRTPGRLCPGDLAQRGARPVAATGKGRARRAFTAEPTVPDATDDIARRDRLLQALLELPLQQRMTVVLRYLEDMTQVETAKALGCSEGTVKSQSSRALATLRLSHQDGVKAMNSQEETQLSDDLHRIVDGPPATLDIDAIERSGQRQRRRSLAVRGLAGIGVLGVAVVGSLAAASHSGTTGSVAGQAAARTATGKAAAKPARTGRRSRRSPTWRSTSRRRPRT